VPYHGRTWGWIVSAIERAIVPRCAAVITVSDGIATRLRDRYGLSSTPTVVRNVSALQVKGNGGLRTKLGPGPEVPLVLHQGAPAPDRGCEALLCAAASMDGVHIVFLGDPEPGYHELLSAMVRDKGVTDRVTLLPSVPLDELLAYTAEADVGVTLLQDTCENHRLALPNKLFEYIAAGLPVVASDLPEMNRLIESYGIGWCVEPDRPQALAVTLSHAIAHRGDPGLRRNLVRAATELTWSREQVRLTDLYAELGSWASTVGPKRFPRRRRRGVSATLSPR
jgi:glycosyltransferase involved in cell wall biosynthesis